CMVCNCFFEARGQNFDEQVMVNRAVLSRVLSPAHPNNVCGVVHQKSQFSWTIDFKNQRVRSNKKNQNLMMGEKSKDLKKLDKQAFRSCVASSREAFKYDSEFFASYYVSKRIKTPNWLNKCQSRSRKKKIKITNKDNKIGKRDLAHSFYRVCEPRENVCLNSPDCKGES
ncbi:MAG: cell wall hydrolase, partial [Bdellovibrionales bacterium]